MAKVTSNQFKPIKDYYDNNEHHIVYPNFEKIVTKKPKKEIIGQLQLKIKFYKKNRIPITEFGYSYFYDLSNKEQYNKAKIVAFKSAYKLIPFSPDNFEITGEKFIYVKKLIPA